MPETTPKQAAVIPIRRDENGELQVCLLRKGTSNKWGIPKGFIERGVKPQDAALQEADEEAGLRGRIIDTGIGTYEYTKRGVPLTVLVFVMEVVEERTRWPEMSFRKRRWCSLAQARQRLKNHAVYPLFDRFRPPRES